MSDESPCIWIVDDDSAVRGSLGALLGTRGYRTVSSTSASDFLTSFDPSRADCVLLDIRMPGMDGLTLLENLGPKLGDLPVIIVTAHGDVPSAVRAMRAGAVDFIEKPIRSELLFESLSRALSKQGGDAPEVDTALSARFATLTPREYEVMREMVIGYPTKIIAHNLGLSSRTVEIHRARVMQKVGVKSLAHLVRLALRAGHDPEPD